MSDLYTGVFGRTLLDNGHNRDRPDHFVPEGWDELDRGICPACGCRVSWKEDLERWTPDSSLTVLVLTPNEMHLIFDEDPSEAIQLMHELNHP